jgi:hypothetical protein
MMAIASKGYLVMVMYTILNWPVSCFYWNLSLTIQSFVLCSPFLAIMPHTSKKSCWAMDEHSVNIHTSTSTTLKKRERQQKDKAYQTKITQPKAESPTTKQRKGKTVLPTRKQRKGKTTAPLMQEIQCSKQLKSMTPSYKEDSDNNQSKSKVHKHKPSKKRHQSSKNDDDTNSTASKSIDESPNAHTPLAKKDIFDPFTKAAWEEGRDWRLFGTIDY